LEKLKAKRAEHILCAAPVMDLAFGELQKDRQAEGIDKGVDLCRQPATRATHATRSRRLFCRWRRADGPGWMMSRSSGYRHYKPLKPQPKCGPKRLPYATGWSGSRRPCAAHSDPECPPTAAPCAVARISRSKPADRPPEPNRAVCSAAGAPSPTTRSPSNRSEPSKPPALQV